MQYLSVRADHLVVVSPSMRAVGVLLVLEGATDAIACGHLLHLLLGVIIEVVFLAFITMCALRSLSMKE